MATNEPMLKTIRNEIDQIDYQIHDLLNERAKLALKIKAAKINAQGEETNFHRPKREQEILSRIHAYNKGPLASKAVANIFRCIMAECLALQKQ